MKDVSNVLYVVVHAYTITWNIFESNFGGEISAMCKGIVYIGRAKASVRLGLPE